MHKISPTNSRHPLRPCGLVLVCNWVIYGLLVPPTILPGHFPKSWPMIEMAIET